MSVTHLDSIEGTRGSEGSRKPPQDIPAEQSVLGGMMLSKDAIADVVEILRGQDFYRPRPTKPSMRPSSTSTAAENPRMPSRCPTS
ncbi:hypothetical protein QFZ33_000183 [Arthrobacter globiformis]|nr:hypothetical protein [Arthrobacter globiformis]